MRKYKIIETELTGTTGWIVSVENSVGQYEEWRSFWEDDGESEETACATAEAYGYEYGL